MKVLASYGLKAEETLVEGEEKLNPLPSPQCDEENPATGRFCLKC